MNDLIARLSTVWGPPGHEQKVAATLADLIRPHVDTVGTDRLGNLIASKSGRGPQLLLAAHMDAPGGIITQIEASGLLRTAGLGAFSPAFAVGQRVVFPDGTHGTVAVEPGTEPRDVTAGKLLIDIGAADAAETASHVSVGECWSYAAPCLTQGHRVLGPALDGRAPCAVLLEVARNLHLTSGECGIQFAFLVQEATGTSSPRGGGPVAFGLEPDLAVVVEATDAGDVPGGPRTRARLGGGVTLPAKYGRFLPHLRLRRHLEELATAHAIPWTGEVVVEGDTAAAGVQLAGAGAPTALVGIPLRYRGGPGELVDVRDARAAADLLLKLLSDPAQL